MSPATEKQEAINDKTLMLLHVQTGSTVLQALTFILLLLFVVGTKPADVHEQNELHHEKANAQRRDALSKLNYIADELAKMKAEQE